MLARLPALLLAALWLPALGCTVTASADSAPSIWANQCENDGDCPGGACMAGLCSAPNGQLSTVLFEVTPPADSEAPGVRFLKRIENLSPGGGEHDIALQRVAHVTGHVTSSVASPSDSGCRDLQFNDVAGGSIYSWAENGDLPVRVIITPSVKLLGISTETYAAQALPALDADDVALPAASLPYSLNLPPGQYDIYLQTLPAQGEASLNQEHCLVPPHLYRRQEITSGEVALNFELNEPSILDLTIDLPVGVGPFNDWTVDVLDATSGRPLSHKVRLGDPTPSGERFAYHAKILYSQVLGDRTSAMPEPNAIESELVRLAPPENETAPTIIMLRWVLDLYGDGAATINQLTPLPQPVEVEGQVQAVGQIPESATVTLIATKITGLSEGITGSFTRTVKALAGVERPSDPPKFKVNLLPGKYLVYAVPPAGSGLAATETTWEVGEMPLTQAGKVIELKPEARLVGSVLDPTASAALAGASVNAIAVSSSTSVSARDQTVGGVAAFVPRATTAVVDAQGAFELRADPGFFDLSVRPTVSSGFAWRVQSNVAVSGEGQDLGQLVLPLPIVYQGAVTFAEVGDPKATGIPNALIRAFVYLDGGHGFTADPDNAADPARSVVQIAETRADDLGFFKLLVPSHLH